METIIRECKVPHHGECDRVLPEHTILSTLRHHGFTAQAKDGRVEAWEPATIIPLDGSGPVRDASAWVTVPAEVHALAEWLGY